MSDETIDIYGESEEAVEEEVEEAVEEEEEEEVEEEEEEEDTPEEIIIDDVTYWRTNDGIVDPNSTIHVKVCDDPQEEDPKNWDLRYQNRHAKNIEKIQKSK